ncbi:MAG: hypothetical protein HDR88_12740 [Bacteroides sp.]|nr:hypothetical protein [Bacteroides sp.]
MPLIIVAAFLVIMMAGCTPPVHDSRLIAAHELIAKSPKEALDSLGRINRSGLSESDSHYLDFLTIKATDKAYLPHSSDSTILEVIAYAESHRREGYYPEALYYGGRVYSDLGDYPTALDYFHQALDLLPPDTKDQELRSRIVSQIGSLLNTLRLYDEAIPYINESLLYSKQTNDTIGEVLDLQLLGLTYMRAKHWDMAGYHLKLALELSQRIEVSGSPHRAKSKMLLAAVKRQLGQTDSALFYIRNTLDSVKPIVRNNVLAHGAQIYWQAGIWDTAYFYAYQLIHSPMLLNQKIGYEMIFLDSVIKYVPGLINFLC